MKSSNILKVVGALIVVLAIIGAYGYPKATVNTNVQAVGTVFNSAKVAQVNMSPATGSATSTSILNTDDNNRYVKGAFGFCTGVTQTSDRTIAALTVQAATTSTANPVLVTNTNLAANLTIATSTAFSSQSSTTVAASVLSVWASGSYLTFSFNATNTAACTVGVSYAAS